MKRLSYIIMAIVLLLTACTYKNGNTQTLSSVKAMNLSNGGKMVEATDGSIFIADYNGTSGSVIKIHPDQSQTTVSEKWSMFLFEANGHLYYCDIKSGETFVMTLDGKNAELVTRLEISSMAEHNGKLYLIARPDFEHKYQLYVSSYDGTNLQIVESPLELRTVLSEDGTLYVSANEQDGPATIYSVSPNLELTYYAEFPEPIQKFLFIDSVLYGVGNSSIMRRMDGASVKEIAPTFNGLSESVNILDGELIYGGFSGTFAYSPKTETTKAISKHIYSAIYVIQGAAIGVTTKDGVAMYTKILDGSNMGDRGGHHRPE